MLGLLNYQNDKANIMYCLETMQSIRSDPPLMLWRAGHNVGRTRTSEEEGTGERACRQMSPSYP